MKKDKTMRVTSLEQKFIKEMRNKKVRDLLKESIKLSILEKQQLKKELHINNDWFIEEINILSSMWYLLQDMEVLN